MECGAAVRRDGQIVPCGKAAVASVPGPTYQPQPERAVKPLHPRAAAAYGRETLDYWRTPEPGVLQLWVCEEHR